MPSGISRFWHDNKYRRTHNDIKNSKTVLFVGRLDRNKNIKSVVHACSKLHAQGMNLQLKIVGSGPLESWITHISSRFDFIEYVGNLNKGKLLEAYRTADILAVPSKGNIWFGLSRGPFPRGAYYI